jgi:hypothetical protein
MTQPLGRKTRALESFSLAIPAQSRFRDYPAKKMGPCKGRPVNFKIVVVERTRLPGGNGLGLKAFFQSLKKNADGSGVIFSVFGKSRPRPIPFIHLFAHDKRFLLL